MLCVAATAICFTKELVDQSVSELGTTVTLECELSREGLSVEWFKENKKVMRDLKHDFVNDKKSHKLVISKVDWEDTGNYRCEYKLLSTQAKLSVEGTCQESGVVEIGFILISNQWKINQT